MSVGKTKNDISNEMPEETSERELTITRILDAPPIVIFKVWTQPNHLMRWWGPKGFITPSCDMDIQQGGRYRICIRSPEGTNYWMQGVYREIVEPERLVFTFAWEDDNGHPVHESLVTVTFSEHNDRTKMTFHQAYFRSIIERDDHHEGWSECFDRLKIYVAEF